MMYSIMRWRWSTGTICFVLTHYLKKPKSFRLEPHSKDHPKEPLIYQNVQSLQDASLKYQMLVYLDVMRHFLPMQICSASMRLKSLLKNLTM